MKRRISLLLCVPLLALGGCVGYEKSENPLGPTVAGPIPGVQITQPIPLNPWQGSKVSVEEQPLTLTLENSSTSGVRPISYLFEVAADASFQSKIFVREGVQPGAGGKTSLRLPENLAPERSYYWRAKAQDGANASGYTYPVVFTVFTPIVIGKPRAISPDGSGQKPQPRFEIGHAPRSGPVGPIVYLLEVAEVNNFGTLLGQWAIPEHGGATTHLDSPIVLPAGKKLFWRAKAYDPTTVGPWSDTQDFQVTAASPGPSPGGNCGSADQSTPLASLQALRPCYPTPMSHGQLGDLLNRVAWHHRGAGYGLHRKESGNRCPQPGGVDISCDILVHGPTQAVYDVFLDAEGPAQPTWGYKGQINTMSNFVNPKAP